MVKIAKKNIFLTLGFFLMLGALAVLYSFLVSTSAFAADCCNQEDSYRINAGASIDIREHGICRRVINSSSAPDTFIPTKTAGEWQEFINNSPSHISFSNIVEDSGWVYGTWSSCSAACDGGTKTRNKKRTVSTWDFNCNKDTNYYSSTDSTSCNTQSCPTCPDPVYDYGDDGSCNTRCERCSNTNENELVIWWQTDGSCTRSSTDVICSETRFNDPACEPCTTEEPEPPPDEPAGTIEQPGDPGECNTKCSRCSNVNSQERAEWYESDGDCGRDAVCSETTYTYDASCPVIEPDCTTSCSQCSTDPSHEGELATWKEIEGADCDRSPLSDVCSGTTYTANSSCAPEEPACTQYDGTSCGGGGECQTSNDCSPITSGTSCSVNGESGTYQSGLCPGGTETRCCVPDTSFTCNDYTGTPCGGGGECQTSNSCSPITSGTSCTVDGQSGTYQSGLCSGGSETKCCVPNSTSGGGGGGTTPTYGTAWRCHYYGGGVGTTSWVCGTGTNSDGVSYSYCDSSMSSAVETVCSEYCSNGC